MTENSFIKMFAQHSNSSKVRSLKHHPLVQVLCSAEAIAIDSCGWGYQRSGQSAMKSADFVLLEDGFIRSLFPDDDFGIPYSLVVDRSGIYYDGSGVSDLIKFLNGEHLSGGQWSNKIEPEEVGLALERVRGSGVSQYNDHVDRNRELDRGVLVVDQTAGDISIRHSGMQAGDFDRMLKDALQENPGSKIYVRTHPDHECRQKHSCFSEELLASHHVTILPSDMPFAEALRFCHTVYVGSSLLGMEGLIHQRKVITYGWSFYAGWGLTVDRATAAKPLRKRQLSVEVLFEAAYLRYTQYFDPDTQEPCDIHRVIDHILFQWESWKVKEIHCVTCGLTPRQDRLLTDFLGPKNGDGSCEDEAVLPLQVITWGAKEVPDKLADHPVTRLEDGFIHALGIGTHFNAPLSWVFDDVGIYFDARAPSKLENLLENHEFSTDDLEQADELISFLRENKQSKQNVGLQELVIPTEAGAKTVILIPGQADSDASIKFGSPKLRNNRELIAEVRRQNPDAFICYRPHPDLVSGAHTDGLLWEGIELEVDHLATEGDITTWIQAVDEVHTLTSAVGFEALIHGKPVHTYGLPFYAGWGLNSDWLSCERRSRQRSLAELVGAVLIHYPTYLNPRTKEFTTAMNVAKLLADPQFDRDSRSGMLKLLDKVKSTFNKLLRQR